MLFSLPEWEDWFNKLYDFGINATNPIEYGVFSLRCML